MIFRGADGKACAVRGVYQNKRKGFVATQSCLTLSLQSDSGGAGIQTKKEENLYIVSAGLFLLLL